MKKVYLLFSVMLLVLAACQSLPTPKSNMVVIDYAVFPEGYRAGLSGY
mgnify:CR=1 FL=1